METAINKVYSLLEPLTLKRLHTREQEDNEVNKTSGKYKWLKEKKRRRKDRKKLYLWGKKERKRTGSDSEKYLAQFRISPAKVSIPLMFSQL